MSAKPMFAGEARKRAGWRVRCMMRACLQTVTWRDETRTSTISCHLLHHNTRLAYNNTPFATTMMRCKSVCLVVLIFLGSGLVDAYFDKSRSRSSKTVLKDNFPLEEPKSIFENEQLVESEHNVVVSHAKTRSRGLQQALRSLALVSCINIFINLFRPDPDMNVAMRMPRVCWEICIGFIAMCAQLGEGSILLLFLALMIFPTACMDIFVWGPVFGAFTEFESCTGGWFTGRPRMCTTDYSKGIGRMLGMMQSIFGGLFYLLAATLCWSEYWKVQADKQALRQARFIDGTLVTSTSKSRRRR